MGKISESHTAVGLQFLKLTPGFPMHFLTFFRRAPPEISAHGLNFLINRGRDSEIRHGIGGYYLNHRLNKDFTTPFGKEHVFPAIQLFGYTVSEIPELNSLAMG